MIVVDKNICDFCGTCVACCPQNAIEVLETNWQADQEACNECRQCIQVCPVKALESHHEE